MANPLQAGMMPPEAPEQPNAIQSGAVPLGQQGPVQGGQPQAPAPTHAQTVAALRQFTAVKNELDVLLKNPDLGKTDMKSAIIDGATKLVADRIIPPGQMVQQLASVPDSPFQQKKWIEDNYAQTMRARDLILNHHGAAFAGQPPQETPDSSDHMQDIQGLMDSHYSGRLQ